MFHMLNKYSFVGKRILIRRIKSEEVRPHFHGGGSKKSLNF